MYTATINGYTLFNPGGNRTTLLSPTLKLEENASGEFTFTMFKDHPMYDDVEEMTSIIKVYNDGVEIWEGRVIEIETTFAKAKKVTCEGELAYLNDSIQRQVKYQGCTLRQYLAAVLDAHNAQVDESKNFVLGEIEIEDDYIYKYTNYECTLEVLKTDFLDTYGGFFRIRKVDGVRYLDYLKTYLPEIDQRIEFGRNLLDFSKNVNAEDLATAIIPLGKTIESDEEGDEDTGVLDKKTTIESVNEGKDYIQSDEAVKAYGFICKVVEWSDVSVPANLLTKAQAYLSDIQFADMSLSVNALDMHLTDKTFDSIGLLDNVRVVSVPHGLDRLFPVTEIEINLNNPADNTLTLGTSQKKTSLSTRTESANKEILKKVENQKSTVLEQAQKNASELIKNGFNGYVSVNDSEILIMDSDDKDVAKKVWRWNSGGLGYSSTGYDGDYGLAMTMDGAIVADFITAGTLDGSLIKGESIEGDSIAAGTITATNIASNTITTTQIAANTITGDNIKANSITADEINVTDLMAENLTATGTFQVNNSNHKLSVDSSAVTMSDGGNNSYISLTKSSGLDLYTKSGDIDITSQSGNVNISAKNLALSGSTSLTLNGKDALTDTSQSGSDDSGLDASAKSYHKFQVGSYVILTKTALSPQFSITNQAYYNTAYYYSRVFTWQFPVTFSTVYACFVQCWAYKASNGYYEPIELKLLSCSGKTATGVYSANKSYSNVPANTMQWNIIVIGAI